MPNKAAVVKLQNSKLYSQNQLLLTDVEMKSLNLALKGKASTHIVEAITDATVTRTIEGASTVEITLFDRDREILQSGRLTSKTDIQIDGLWFRLRSIRKQGDSLTLMFEDREVSILRLYTSHMVAARDTLSRTRFIKKMIDEVKEMKIPFVCPEMDKLPPIRTIGAGGSGAFYQPQGQQEWERAPGFGVQGGDAPGTHFAGTITVRRLPADLVQMENTHQVLSIGVERGASWSVLISAIEVINEESNARNLTYSRDGLSAGIFQQRYHKGNDKYWGTYEQVQDINYSANKYYDAAIHAYLADPTREPEVIAQHAQSVMYMDHIVALWKTFREEAERTLQRWGVPKDTPKSGINAKTTIEQRRAQEAAAGSAASDRDKSAEAAGSLAASLQLESENYQFHRGIAATVDGQEIWRPESTWECAGRLAEEINWRRFMVSGTFYLMSEPYLFRSKPLLKLDEQTTGVVSIDGEYTVGTRNASVSITARVGRWAVPPGSMVEVFKSGPLSGRWLVSEISRNLFDTEMEIRLKKPRPILAEPNLDQEKGLTFSMPGKPIATSSYGEADTTTVPVAKPESLRELRDLINQGKVTFNHANDRQGMMLSGSVRRVSNGELVPIDPAIITFMVWAGRQWNFRVWSMIGTHDQYVAGSGNTRESRHWTGHAIDIDKIGTTIVESPSARPAVLAFMTTVGKLAPGFIPNQMICNGCGSEDVGIQALQLNDGNVKGGHWVDGHTDHVHIGY